MTLNEVQYGNPAAEVLPYIDGDSFLNILFAELTTKISFPYNDSNTTKEELNSLVVYTKQLQQNPRLADQYFEYDENIYNWFLSIGFEGSEEETKKYRAVVETIFSDCLPLVYKLKMHFNRPRPFQLAGYHRSRLFPFHSRSVNSASFPSMYACLAAVVAGVCGNHYPDLYKYFTDIKNDVAYSRLYMGVNYHSDISNGFIVADKILENKEFKIKYKL